MAYQEVGETFVELWHDAPDVHRIVVTNRSQEAKDTQDRIIGKRLQLVQSNGTIELVATFASPSQEAYAFVRGADGAWVAAG